MVRHWLDLRYAGHVDGGRSGLKRRKLGLDNLLVKGLEYFLFAGVQTVNSLFGQEVEE